MKLNLRNTRLIAVMGIFLLSFLSHFAYEILPNPIFSFIFPVNESIWEHMKIIYTSFVFGSFFEKFLLKNYNVKYHNFNIEIFVKAFLGIISYLIIYRTV